MIAASVRLPRTRASLEFDVFTFGLAAADVDGDGNRDIVVSNQHADTVSVLLGDGRGGVARVVEVGAPNEPTAVAIADFNGDGRADVTVTGYSSGNVAVLLGTRDDGLLAGAPRRDVFGVVTSTALADFDLDGIPDLIVARQSAGVFAMRGRGDGTFAAPEQLSQDFVANDLIVGDFNVDGLPDIAYDEGLAIVTLLQRADGTFARVTTNFSGIQ